MPDDNVTPTISQSVTERGLGSKVIPGHLIISDNPEMSAKAHWYVVHTYSGHEARVAETLRQRVATLGQTDKVFEVLIPTQDKIQIRHGKKSSVKEKIFPGYLLVKMILDDDSWLVVRTTAGVTGFVGVGSKPTPLSNPEVEAIMQFAQIGAPKYKANFSVGEAVKITDGPFADFLGSIESIDEDAGKLRVLVSIFGRETPVELDFLQVKKI
jgi:transcriptional antiterminator NusG